MAAAATQETKDVASRVDDPQVKALLKPSLYRLTDGIPRRELKVMISESKACEEALEREIQQLEEALKNEGPKDKKSAVDIMLESEITPPDRYFAVSALFGRLRDDLSTPLPPNSTLPALRAQHGLLQPAQKKKKTSLSNDLAAQQETPSDLEKQKRLLGLEQNSVYRKEQDSPAPLLALWKKISTHRTSVVFRRPVNPKEAPGYTDRIIFPMDLSLIRKMIVARMIKSFADFHKRIALICHNCVKYNGRESDYGLVTREFEGVADEFFIAAVMAAGAVTAIRPDSSSMSVDKDNTATAVASLPVVAKNPETRPAVEKKTAATAVSNKES